MEYTEQQRNEFRTEFARRRRNQMIASVPMIAAILGVVLGEQYVTDTAGLPVEFFAGAAVVVILGGLGFSLFNWRCPACRKYLGKGISPNHCPNCGVGLRAR